MLYDILSYFDIFGYFNYCEEVIDIPKKKFIAKKPEKGIDIHDELHKELKDYFKKNSTKVNDKPNN